jgi:hypothetical protein
MSPARRRVKTPDREADVDLFQKGGSALRALRDFPTLDVRRGDLFILDAEGTFRCVVRALSFPDAAALRVLIPTAPTAEAEPVTRAEIRPDPGGAEALPLVPVSPAARVEGEGVLDGLKARAWNAVEGARHVLQAAADDPDVGLLAEDLVYFDAAGRPVAVVRALVGAVGDMYRLRFGRKVERFAGPATEGPDGAPG